MTELVITCVTAIIIALILAGGISRAAYWIAMAIVYKRNSKRIDVGRKEED